MKLSIVRNPANQGTEAPLAASIRRPTPRRRASARGFSMVELVTVVAIALVAMAIATPIMLNTVNAARMRNQMSDLSGIVQMCRSKAVQQNENRELFFDTDQGKEVAYIDVPNSTAPAVTEIDPQVWMPSYFTKVAAPTGTPTPLDSTVMWNDGLGNLPDTTHPICFNSRGIPCQCTSGSNAATDYCAGITNGYAFYFTLTSQPGGTRWAAVGISPAGRIKTFFWDGSKWSD